MRTQLHLTQFTRAIWLASLVMIVALGLAVPAQAALNIDFSSANGFGGSGLTSTQFQINNIGLDVANPFDPTQVLTSRFNVKWCLNTDERSSAYLHLIACGLVQSSGSGATTQRGTVIVTVNSATGSGPISGATVSMGGGNSQVTGSDGTATFTNVPAGSATQFLAGATGYVATSAGATATAGGSTSLTISLQPVSDTRVGTGGVRIVLNWGQNPSDLDSHLTGPASSGTTRFHTAYYSTNRTGTGSTSTATDSTLPFLDVDDVSSFGPETITIPTTAQRSGTYRYSVHHYSGSSSICASPARVTVYQGTTEIRSFSPASTGCAGTGDIWTVFTLAFGTDGSANLTPYTGAILTGQSSTSSQFKEYAGALVESEDPSIFWYQPAK